MSDLVELVDWLRTTIEGDKAAAEAATEGPWSVDGESYPEAIDSADGTAVVAGGRWGGEAPVFETTGDALHIARHDPRDVIARCEAELRLIDYLLEPSDNGNPDEDGLRLLASGYRHRDGYLPEWAPPRWLLRYSK